MLEDQLAELRARTDGQILTTLHGVAVIRAAAFAAHTEVLTPSAVSFCFEPLPGFPITGGNVVIR